MRTALLACTGMAAAGAAVATLPAFGRAREGIREGLSSELQLGGAAAQGWLLQGTGGLMGGACGWTVSSAMMERAAAKGSSLAAYVRVPAAVVGALFSASVAAEFAEPAVISGKRIGRAVSLGIEGLVEDLQGGTSTSSSSSGGLQVPRALLEDSRRRMGAVSGEAAGPKEATAEDDTAESEEEQGVAAVVERLLHEDGAKVKFMSELRALRSREAALRKELTNVPSSRAERRGILKDQIYQVVEMKKTLKAKCLGEFGVKLGRLISGEIQGKAEALEELRARQLSLRMQLQGCDNQRSAEARDLQRQIKQVDKEKKQLKHDAKHSCGVKLSDHAKTMAKYP